MNKSLDEQADLLIKSGELTGNMEHLSVGVAAKNLEVSEALQARLNDGLLFRGASVTRTGDRSAVTFHFEGRGDVISLLPPSVQVLVDLKNKSVIGIDESPIQGTTSQTDGNPVLPFALAVPSNAPNVLTESARAASFLEREQNYVAAMMPQPFIPPFGQNAFGGPNQVGPNEIGFNPTANYRMSSTNCSTYCSCSSASTSISGGRSDDTTSDYVTDDFNMDTWDDVA